MRSYYDPQADPRRYDDTCSKVPASFESVDGAPLFHTHNGIL